MGGHVTGGLQVDRLREKHLKRELTEQISKNKKLLEREKHEKVRELEKLRSNWARKFGKAFARESHLVIKLQREAVELQKRLKQETIHGLLSVSAEKARQKKIQDFLMSKKQALKKVILELKRIRVSMLERQKDQEVVLFRKIHVAEAKLLKSTKGRIANLVNQIDALTKRAATKRLLKERSTKLYESRIRKTTKELLLLRGQEALLLASALANKREMQRLRTREVELHAKVENFHKLSVLGQKRSLVNDLKRGVILRELERVGRKVLAGMRAIKQDEKAANRERDRLMAFSHTLKEAVSRLVAEKRSQKAKLAHTNVLLKDQKKNNEKLAKTVQSMSQEFGHAHHFAKKLENSVKEMDKVEGKLQDQEHAKHVLLAKLKREMRKGYNRVRKLKRNFRA